MLRVVELVGFCRLNIFLDQNTAPLEFILTYIKFVMWFRIIHKYIIKESKKNNFKGNADLKFKMS